MAGPTGPQVPQAAPSEAQMTPSEQAPQAAPSEAHVTPSGQAAPSEAHVTPSGPAAQVRRVPRVMRWRLRLRTPAADNAAAANAAASTSSQTPPTKNEQAESLGVFADPDNADELCEQLGDYDCPVCLELFCEPVVAGCGRHVFCRNCLLRTQRLRAPPRCPVCRQESRPYALDIPEVPWLVAKLEVLDPTYKERVLEAQKDRERDFAQKAANRTTIVVPVPRVPSVTPIVNGVLEHDGLSRCTCGPTCCLM